MPNNSSEAGKDAETIRLLKLYNDALYEEFGPSSPRMKRLLKLLPRYATARFYEMVAQFNISMEPIATKPTGKKQARNSKLVSDSAFKKFADKIEKEIGSAASQNIQRVEGE